MVGLYNGFDIVWNAYKQVYVMVGLCNEFGS